MKTKLLKRLRKEARENVPPPECTYQSFGNALKAIMLYEDEKCDYILRRVRELKQKRRGNIHDNPELLKGGEQ